MNAAGEDIARVTVIAPNRRIDLALPGEAVLGEVMPTIVRFAGLEQTAPEAVSTWVLQRVGEDPLDANKVIAALNIRDGETLHLRQREAVLPDAAFDDVVDAVATTASRRPSWTPAHSMRVALGVLLVALIGGSLLVLVGDHQIPAVASVFGLGLASGIAAVVASRAYGQRSVAAALAWSCVALSLLSGFYLLAPMDQGLTQLWGTALLSWMLLLGLSLGLLAASAMALAAHVQVHALLTACVTTLLLLLTGVGLAFLPTHQAEVCATALVVLLAITPGLPWLSYTVAQIAMPNLPSQVELLMADDQPVQADIVARATTADRLLACFLTASAIATAVLALPVVARGTLPALLLVGACALAMMLRARAFVGVVQRLALLLGGIALLGEMAYWLLTHPQTGTLRLLVAVLVLAAMTAVLAQYAAVFHARIMAPIWGRLADILEWLAVMAIIPMLLWLLNVYALARGLPG